MSYETVCHHRTDRNPFRLPECYDNSEGELNGKNSYICLSGIILARYRNGGERSIEEILGV